MAAPSLPAKSLLKWTQQLLCLKISTSTCIKPILILKTLKHYKKFMFPTQSRYARVFVAYRKLCCQPYSTQQWEAKTVVLLL